MSIALLLFNIFSKYGHNNQLTLDGVEKWGMACGYNYSALKSAFEQADKDGNGVLSITGKYFCIVITDYRK